MDDATTYIIEHLPTTEREEIRFFKTDSVGKVINSACKLFKVNPQEYELRYANKKLDPNLFLMYSNLPDGGYLELCPIEKNKENEKSVVVNLVVGDETVNTGKFKKTTSLWDVSQKLLPNGMFVEDDRLCLSYLSKNMVGPDKLKKVPLSSLKTEEGPIVISLNRHYSREKLAVLNRSKESEIDHNEKNLNSTPKSITEKTNTKGVGTARTRYSKKVTFMDMREIPTKIKNSKTSGLKAKVAIDKTFYLTPGKKLTDIKYLNSREGIAYILKKPKPEEQREESAVNLLDLREDYNRTFNDEIQLKVILPDDIAVQAIFKKDETVEDVLAFLSPLLQCQDSEYFLHSMNPRQIVENTRSLKDLEGYNGVTLYLKLDPKTQRTWPKSRPYLKKDHLPKKEYLI